MKRFHETRVRLPKRKLDIPMNTVLKGSLAFRYVSYASRPSLAVAYVNLFFLQYMLRTCKLIGLSSTRRKGSEVWALGGIDACEDFAGFCSTSSGVSVFAGCSSRDCASSMTGNGVEA